jgi:hypothetical protein
MGEERRQGPSQPGVLRVTAVYSTRTRRVRQTVSLVSLQSLKRHVCLSVSLRSYLSPNFLFCLAVLSPCHCHDLSLP